MVNHECYRIKNQIVLWYHKTEPVTHFQLIRSIRSGRAHLLYMHCCVDLEPGYTYRSTEKKRVCTRSVLRLHASVFAGV